MADEKLIADCPERVAYDLALWISTVEKGQKSRKEVLKLYAECISTVRSGEYIEPEKE